MYDLIATRAKDMRGRHGKPTQQDYCWGSVRTHSRLNRALGDGDNGNKKAVNREPRDRHVRVSWTMAGRCENIEQTDAGQRNRVDPEFSADEARRSQLGIPQALDMKLGRMRG